jgi:hypothetical protein
MFAMKLKLTKAEEEMIFDTHFLLTIVREGDQWHISYEDHDSGHICNGHGQTFDQAWDALDTPFLRIDDD